VLRATAEEVGLDPESLTRSLQAGEYLDRLLAAEADARRLGITGVPTFFIAGPSTDDPAMPAPARAKSLSRRIVGAQPFEVFRSALLDL
jgi:predicted DsbA family dithiol-disulfide isomerase